MSTENTIQDTTYISNTQEDAVSPQELTQEVHEAVGEATPILATEIDSTASNEVVEPIEIVDADTLPQTLLGDTAASDKALEAVTQGMSEEEAKTLEDLLSPEGLEKLNAAREADELEEFRLITGTSNTQREKYLMLSGSKIQFDNNPYWDYLLDFGNNGLRFLRDVAMSTYLNAPFKARSHNVEELFTNVLTLSRTYAAHTYMAWQNLQMIETQKQAVQEETPELVKERQALQADYVSAQERLDLFESKQGELLMQRNHAKQHARLALMEYVSTILHELWFAEKLCTNPLSVTIREEAPVYAEALQVENSCAAAQAMSVLAATEFVLMRQTSFSEIAVAALVLDHDAIITPNEEGHEISFHHDGLEGDDLQAFGDEKNAVSNAYLHPWSSILKYELEHATQPKVPTHYQMEV